jgi:hypothetical protein
MITRDSGRDAAVVIKNRYTAAGIQVVDPAGSIVEVDSHRFV